MARPPGAKANLLITFTLGDVIKERGLFLSVSMQEKLVKEAEEKSIGGGWG